MHDGRGGSPTRVSVKFNGLRCTRHDGWAWFDEDEYKHENRLGHDMYAKMINTEAKSMRNLNLALRQYCPTTAFTGKYCRT